MMNTQEELFDAICEGNLELVEKYLEEHHEWLHFRFLQHSDMTPLLLAVSKKHLALVAWLFQKGALLTEKDKMSRTALLLAVQNGDLEMVSWLLTQDLSIHEKDNTGMTALLWGAKKGHRSILELLLSQENTILNEKDNAGRGALSWAALNGHLDIVEYLFESGASLVEKDKNGKTPLLHAASKGHITTMAWLLEQGVSLAEKDKLGFTALQQAACQEQLEAAEWIVRNFWPILPPDEIKELRGQNDLFGSNLIFLESLIFQSHFPMVDSNCPLERQSVLKLKKLFLSPIKFEVLLHLLHRYPSINELEINENSNSPHDDFNSNLHFEFDSNPIDQPFIIKIKHCSFKKNSFLLLISFLEKIEGLTFLDITHNKLSDDYAQIIADKLLKGMHNLLTLDIHHNYITATGLKELMKACKNHNLSDLNIHHNLLVIQSDKTTQELSSLIEKTNLQSVDISANYLGKKIKPILEAPHARFFCSSAIDLPPQQSLLHREINLTYAEGAVYLLRNTQSRDEQHTMLLIEGLYKFGQCFLIMYDFRPKHDEDKHGKVSEETIYDPVTTLRRLEAYCYKAYPASRVNLKKLLRFIEADREKELFYGVRGIPSSKGRTYNCYTWALEKLIEVGLESPKSQPALVALPSLYLRGQKVRVEPNLSEGISESHQVNSCFIL